MSLTPTAALALDPSLLAARAPAAAAPAAPAPPDSHGPHMPALDGLRGVAVLGVIAFHLLAAPYARGPVWRAVGLVAGAGWLGVELFFVISGCLITGILLDTRGCAAPLRTFWARRALRIVPLYAALMALVFVVLPALVPAVTRTHARLLDAAPLYWTFLANVALARSHGMAAFGTGHLWSVAIEEQFYLLWPLLALRATPRTLARAAAALLAGTCALRAALRLGGAADGYSLYVLTPTHLDGLLVGALLALALRHPPARAWLARHAVRAAAAAGVLVLGVMAAQRSAASHDVPMQVVGYPLVAAMMGGVVARAALARADASDGWWRALGRGPLAHVGAYSYALYLLHYPAMTVMGMFRLCPPRLARAGMDPDVATLGASAAALVLTYALARASWALVERPALSLKRLVPYAGRAAA